MSILNKLSSKLYPKWISKVNKYPTEIQYISAFIDLYKYHPNLCKIKLTPGGATIETPSEYTVDGGYIEQTESPKLSNKTFFYSGTGPDWDIDDNGDVFQLIDFTTMKPANWWEIKRRSIIFYYLKNNKMIKREDKLNKLLDI